MIHKNSADETCANWKLFFEGDDYYAALRRDIARATSSISLESYIFQDDEIGLEIIDALIQRAKSGLNVRVLADGVGSYSLSPEAIARMQMEGVEFAVFRPIRLFAIFSPRSRRRNHRKLVVIDNKICYVGGMNIARENSRRAVGRECWRDSMIRLEGSIARAASHSFLRIWNYVNQRRFRFPQRFAEIRGQVELIENFPRFRRAFRKIYRNYIRGARQRIWIESAYFIPTRSFKKALIHSARRGADVRILVSARSDVFAAQFASRARYKSFLSNGIRIFEYRPRFVHSKSMIVDNEISIIGSANLDHRSFLHDLEISVVAHRSDLNQALAHQFEADLKDAHEITREEWENRSVIQRIVERFFYLFRYFL
ncbi:MAG: hypothetical protein K8S54_16890 [Spirochaetia bacterium]|nr:hypothetical protein [Spirochaetia bacterium]